MKLRFLVAVSALTVLIFSHNSFAGQFVFLDEQQLQSVKASIADGSASEAVKEEYKRLLKSADKLLDGPNYTVVDKTIIPPGATANDFVSISSKAWPSESSSDGFPWAKKDETNPDTKTDKVDRARINDMGKAVYTLSQAYYFSGNVDYATKSAIMLKTWFLANKTRMNPHLQYAQTIPGVDKRSSSGIMDGRAIPYQVLDSINLIRSSGVWSERFDQVMDQWLATYLEYLTGSKMGGSAAKKTDRNGSWYYLQTSALAWYLDDQKVLKRQFKLAKDIMKSQFNGKGGLVKELDRSSSLRDSCFSLEGLTGIAVIADKAGKKFWDLPSKKNSSIGKGINYIMPAVVSGDWSHSDEDIDVSDCLVAIDRYAEYSDSAELKSSVSNLLKEVSDKDKKSSDDKRVISQLTLFKS